MLRFALLALLPAAVFAGCGPGTCCCADDTVVPAWQTSRSAPVKAGGAGHRHALTTTVELPWLKARRQGGKLAG